MVFQQRKSVRLAIAAALVAALAACSGGAGDGAKSVDLAGKDVGAMSGYGPNVAFKAAQPLTFSILYNDHPNYPLRKDWLLWKELAARTNVTLEPTVVPASDYEQKRSLVIGAGDAPLIIPKTYPGQETAFVASGAILPVSDYIDLMPNFKAKIAAWGLEKDLDRLRQQNGKFYNLPGVHEEPWQDYTLAMRTDVLAQLGLATPKNWDEVRTVLAAMKAAHPDTFPLSDRFKGENLLNNAATAFGTAAGWGYNNATWDADAKKFVGTGAMPRLRQLVEYLRSLVKDGLLDPESFTQDDDSATRKLANGRSFVISTNAQNIVNDYRPALAATNPSATIAKIPYPAGPAGDVIPGTTRLENGLMISAKAATSPNFVALMQFIDWLWYSDAGQEFAWWGVPDVTYTKGADGKRALAADLPSKLQLQKTHGFSGGVFAYGGTTELLQSMFSREEVAFQQSIAGKKAVPPPPPYPLTEAEREQATLWETPLKDFTKQMTLKFILGQRDIAEWDTYVKELDAKGMGSYIALVNSAHERFAKEHG